MKTNELPDLTKAPIFLLASIILRDWGPKVNFAAKPYLESMLSLNSASDRDMNDEGKHIINYFLGNASSYRGEVAKAVKTELKRRIK